MAEAAAIELIGLGGGTCCRKEMLQISRRPAICGFR